MTHLAIRRPSRPQRWPMTQEAWHALVEEVRHLRSEVASLAGDAANAVDVAVDNAARRLQMLSTVVEAAEQVHEPGSAVIGRRVTIREADGESIAYSLVFPGDGDPSHGWISADSPLGSAVLGREPGDCVEVTAPAGRRVVTVMSIE